MREIKFRAYDKKIRKFSNFVINCKNSIEFMDDNTCVWYGENHERYKDFELMQYTGLKDKYGIEIYEGDIIKDTFEKVHKIFWHGSFAGFCYEFKNELNKRDFKLLHLAYFNIEVIGNIYENPELLGDDE